MLRLLNSLRGFYPRKQKIIPINLLRQRFKMSSPLEKGMASVSVSEDKKGGKKKSAAESGRSLELNPPPEYLQSRLEMFTKLKVEYDAKVAGMERTPIKITLPDGKVVDGKSWVTTPYDIAATISKGLADNTVVAKVNDQLWDLDRPFEGDASLKLLNFDDDEGCYVFRHSSAHILGEAMERHYGGCLCYGPPVDDGYYYDMYLEGTQVTPSEYPHLDTLFRSIVKEKQPFERLEMKKEDLLEMFKYNKFKCRLIKERVTTPTTTVYRCGPLIDLCRGPHVRHTGKIKSATITKNSSTYWEGNCEAESLQRVYGISFPDNKQLKEWKHFQEEAAKRDHRKLGKEQELYFFHELSPGSCFFLPRGAHIYHVLQTFIREEYRKRGYQEVITPNIYNKKLWLTSGHWEHYEENMFCFDVEKETFALKPMNCPGHFLMFNHRPRSWRELPLRMADFGVLHRNELSGALSGLTRVRRFQQDDSHIFCTNEQIEGEINGCLDFLQYVYGVFGFSFKLYLSTRPAKFMGDPALWDQAEKQLEKSLVEFGYPWGVNPGDGAFYGPKIDIIILDALKRPHQCATIQLDFQQPERFNLHYITGTDCEERKRPVVIHRAILGSVERMMAILTESFGGKWPFWLSPRQVMVIPVSPKFEDYGFEVYQRLHADGFQVDIDTAPGDTFNKKIRNAQLAQYNYLLVVGDKERTNKTANIRTRDNQVLGEMALDVLIPKLSQLDKMKVNDDSKVFSEAQGEQ
ncbi:threonine--tRNA ligase 1, cytoplasmic-like [Halichondria panicea]|uniref:threonine--tRNA ligase 1, cytoplasmic-like n=1 Tax=Halichondria panicea TaxID=6063 RepID=UPI00312B4F82